MGLLGRIVNTVRNDVFQPIGKVLTNGGPQQVSQPQRPSQPMVDPRALQAAMQMGFQRQNAPQLSINPTNFHPPAPPQISIPQLHAMLSQGAINNQQFKQMALPQSKPAGFFQRYSPENVVSSVAQSVPTVATSIAQGFLRSAARVGISGESAVAQALGKPQTPYLVPQNIPGGTKLFGSTPVQSYQQESGQHGGALPGLAAVGLSAASDVPIGPGKLKAVEKAIETSLAKSLAKTGSQGDTLLNPKNDLSSVKGPNLIGNSSLPQTTTKLKDVQLTKQETTAGQALGMSIPQIKQAKITDGLPQALGNTVSQIQAGKHYGIGSMAELSPKEQTAVTNVLSKMPTPTRALPKLQFFAGDLPPMSELPIKNQLFSSKVNALRAINTPSSHELANRIQNIDKASEGLRANWMYQMPTVQKLGSKDFQRAWDIQEGSKALKTDSPQIKQAAGELKNVMGDIHTTGFNEGLIQGAQKNYMPRQYPDNFFTKQKGSAYDSAIQHLMNTKQVDHTQATQLFKDTAEQLARAPKRFGHFEYSRLTDLPGYSKSKSVLNNYVQGASDAVAQARHFGTDNEMANGLLDRVRMEGGDHAAATKAVGNYLRANDNGVLAKPLRRIRGFFGAARLGKAAISHAGQTSNVAVDTRLKDFASGWGKWLSRNAGHKDFIAKTGVTNPQVLHGYQEQYTSVKGALSKATAPGLNSTMKMNRGVAALGYRDYGNFLAKSGNETELRKLGVTGDIGKTLTPEQEIQTARGGVARTMFTPSRATTPTLAETTTGKTVGQYRTAFGYKQTGFIYDRILKEAKNGNIKPLLKHLAVAAPLSYGTIAAKQAVPGSTPEGPGGKALDVLGALGGIPGELAVQGARYGRKDIPKFLAGTAAPLAGEAVSAGEAINKGGKNAERYALGLFGQPGKLLAQKVAPYGPGSTKNQISKGATQPTPGIYQVKGKNGAVKYTTLQSSRMTGFQSLQAAKVAQAKNEFKYSPKQTTTINGQTYHKSSTGRILVGTPKTGSTSFTANGQTVKMSDLQSSHSTNSAYLTSSKNSGDVSGYIKTAQSQLQNISTQLHNPTISQSKAQSLANEAQTLQADIRKYSTYGGFTKPTGVTAVKNLSSIQGANPGYASAITQSAAKYGVDTNAALAVAAAEGLGGGVGDNGTSFGPFQLHIGGALPVGQTQAWAESPAGIDYALKTIASVAGGKSGSAAIQAIVNGFEKPANPSAEIAKALSIYGGSSVKLSSNSPRIATIGSSSSGSRASVATLKLKLPPKPKALKIGKIPTTTSIKVKTGFKMPKVATSKPRKIKFNA